MNEETARNLRAETVALFSNVYLGQRRSWGHDVCTIRHIYETSCQKRIMVVYQVANSLARFVRSLDSIVEFSQPIYEGFGL